MASRIRIKPIGNMGNQMLQYMCALNVRRMTGDTEIFGHDIPAWNLRAPVPDDFSRRPLRLGSHFLEANQIVRLIRKGKARDILLAGLGLRLVNYAPAEFYREIFRGDHVEAEGYDEHHVVLNVRGAEILKNVHSDYRPMPFSYFDTVIEASGAKPVFLGQIGDDDYSRALRERYPGAIFQPSRGALVDFETLRRSRQIAVAASTFSWLAGWLSNASIVHYPLSGIFNPLQRPDIDLAPIDDPRYRFYYFNVEKWSATEAEMERLWTKDERHRTVPPEEMVRIGRMVERRISRLRAWKQFKVGVRAEFHYRLG